MSEVKQQNNIKNDFKNNNTMQIYPSISGESVGQRIDGLRKRGRKMGRIYFIIVITVSILLGGFTIGYFYWPEINVYLSGMNAAKEIVCPLDAKICPDGTSVGRIKPNCDFRPCPDLFVKGDCAKEGEYYSTNLSPETKCCPGISRGEMYSEPYDDCVLAGEFNICINCPNGECGSGENSCNCPQDCLGGGEGDDSINTVGWGIYSDDEYLFEFKHPAEVEFTEIKVEEYYSEETLKTWRSLAVKVSTTTVLSYIPCREEAANHEEYGCDFSINTLTTNMNILDFIGENVDLAEPIDIVSPEGIAYRVTVSAAPKDVMYYIKKGEKLIIIRDNIFWPGKIYDYNSRELAEAIITTFRFIVLDETENWLKFRSPTLKIDIKYPKEYDVYDDYSDNKSIFIGESQGQRAPTTGVLLRIIDSGLDEAYDELKNQYSASGKIFETNTKLGEIKVRVIAISGVFAYTEVHYFFERDKMVYEVIWDKDNEIQAKMMPLITFLVDTDGDNLFDVDEELYGTDPKNADTDGDGYSDLDEIEAGYNPLGDGKFGL